ncbi:MAG: YkgJ family cysteine cluster protein [Planctomycetes bacterium]|nr:YkgJ family cysteine cluster protein [Planctomycetota bacterium]
MARTKKKSIKKNLCDKCTGLCCRYFALPIEDPEDWDDYDDIRWYLSHENCTVFLEDGDWYINLLNPCKNLDANGRCKIYEKRPGICRTYTTDDCDKTGANYDYDLHFTSADQMEQYMKIKFGANVLDKLDAKKSKKKKKKKKSKKK